MPYIPAYPEYTAVAELNTYQDAVERVLNYYARPNTGRDAYLARYAVGEALRKMGQYAWQWYRSTMLLTTEASYSTGTVEYTHSTRSLTLSDGTWPTNAALGHVVIDEVVYTVDKRSSDTVLLLRVDSNPGKNVDADTTYTWFRSHYAIPPDIVELGEPKDTGRRSGGPDLLQLSPDRGYAVQVIKVAVPNSYPYAYTIERDRRTGGKCIVIHPPPATARTYQMTARFYPRRLNVERYNTGTVTTTSGSTTATGTGTAWTQAHVGCVMRISPNTSPPTSQYGARINTALTEIEHNPAAMTRIVTAVAGATSLTLDTAADTAYTAVAYTLSDPLDVDWNVCGTYWDRLVEYYFARNSMDMEQLRPMQKEVDQTFREAVDADRVSTPPPNGLTWWRHWYMDFEYDGLTVI